MGILPGPVAGLSWQQAEGAQVGLLGGGGEAMGEQGQPETWDGRVRQRAKARLHHVENRDPVCGLPRPVPHCLV